MQSKLFKAEISNDKITVSFFERGQKANFFINSIENINENIKLVNQITVFLKNINIKWIKISLEDYKIPVNCVYYSNPNKKIFNCHVEYFEKFYYNNLLFFIKENDIFIEESCESEDGWTTVVHKKKQKKVLQKNKYLELKKNIEELTLDWNTCK